MTDNTLIPNTYCERSQGHHMFKWCNENHPYNILLSSGETLQPIEHTTCLSYCTGHMTSSEKNTLIQDIRLLLIACLALSVSRGRIFFAPSHFQLKIVKKIFVQISRCLFSLEFLNLKVSLLNFRKMSGAFLPSHEFRFLRSPKVTIPTHVQG